MLNTPTTIGDSILHSPIGSAPAALVNTPLPPFWVNFGANPNLKLLPQFYPALTFPIQPHISQTLDYRLGMRQGHLPFKPFQLLEKIDQLQFFLHPTVIGTIPVFVTPHRPDFVRLVQGLLHKNEPHPIPDSMGAAFISGLNNWGRVRHYRANWAKSHPHPTEEAWQAEFKQLIPHKEQYQDQLILAWQGAYSNLPAGALGLQPAVWLDLSLKIRLEHESAHLLTKRAFGVIRRHLHDELLADYAGITAALGFYRADWFLHFLGLEQYPTYRPGGRLENYLDPLFLTEPYFSEITATIVAAAYELEQFDQTLTPAQRTPNGRAQLLLTLAQLSLAQIAEGHLPHRYKEIYHEF